MNKVLKDVASSTLSYLLLLAILAGIILLLWHKIDWSRLDFSIKNPLDDLWEKLFGENDENPFSFPNGVGGRVTVNTDEVDCYKPNYFGDRGEEIKVLQLIINGWLKYNGDSRRIRVNGRFNNKTKEAMEWLDIWHGEDEPYHLFQYNTGLMIGEHAPCKFY